MPATSNLIELRQLLAQRFPHVRMGTARPPTTEAWPTGVPELDALLGGGVPRGELTELVAPHDGSGSAQVIHAWLRQIAAAGQFLALVDGADSFDVGAADPDVLPRLLWVRCRQADEALKAADLLLRDRNFSAIVLDLKLNPPGQLRPIPSSAWHRFGRLLEQNRAAVLVVTPFPLVEGAAYRVRMESRLDVHALSQAPGDVLATLRFSRLRAPAAGTDERLTAEAG